MSWAITILFSITISSFLGFAAYFYSRSMMARRSAVFLKRMDTSEAHASQMLGFRATRLARSMRIQSLLRDVPFVQDLADLLEQSGLSTSVAMLLTQMVAAAAGLVLFTVMLGRSASAAFLLGLVGAVLPVIYVLRMRTLRAIKFELQLPQALELIALYLRSGRSLPQAFIGATEELLPPAAEEFTACAEEYRLGRPLEQALVGLATKYPSSMGFRLFAIAVSVLGQTGGNLVEVLERIKKTLDAGVTYGLRLKAVTGESRLSALILGGLPGIFMAGQAYLNEAYFPLFLNSGTGRILLFLFLILWAGGIFWIRTLIQSKVL